MSTPPRRVLLVSPPWRRPHWPGLAIATLAPILRNQGIVADTLYGSLLFPATRTPQRRLDEHGAFLFAPYLSSRNTLARVTETLDRLYRLGMSVGGILDPERHVVVHGARGAEESKRVLDELTRDRLRSLRGDFERAGQCLDRCFERASSPVYDVVGFSCAFETQLPAALALARRLKAANPGVRIMFGGAACAGEQADGLVASFPEVDAACHFEGEAVIAALVRALRGERPLSEVAGIAYRDPSGAVAHLPSPPAVPMDDLPIPDFDDFMEQHAASEWRAQRPFVFFETARGCWWGEKSLCTFCGINAAGLVFRTKSPERAYDEVQTLYARYPRAERLWATDTILDMKYFKTVLPRLAGMEREPSRPLRIFYEVKSNLTAEQLRVLRAAGVDLIQPGIESFSDEILRLMRKGATSLQQVACLKWAFEAGVKPTYNLLIRNPGERAEHYRETAELLGYIDHLDPPDAITPVYLERYSPLHSSPEEFGIRNVRPKARYDLLYPDPDTDVERLAYMFDFEHDLLDDQELADVHRDVIARVHGWCANFRRGLAFARVVDAALLFVDRRDGVRRGVLTGLARDLYAYVDKPRPTAAIRRRFPILSPDVVDCALDTWSHRRWMWRGAEDRVLAVTPVMGDRNAVRDPLGP